MYCRKCGNKLEDDELFCPKCGTPAAGGEDGRRGRQSAQEDSWQNERYRQETVHRGYDDDDEYDDYDDFDDYDDPEAGRRKRVILISSIVIAAAVCVLVIFVLLPAFGVDITGKKDRVEVETTWKTAMEEEDEEGGSRPGSDAVVSRETTPSRPPETTPARPVETTTAPERDSFEVTTMPPATEPETQTTQPPVVEPVTPPQTQPVTEPVTQPVTQPVTTAPEKVVTVPKVTGLDSADAERTLTDLELIAVVNEAENPDVEDGVVFAQSIDAGEEVLPGETVVLMVAFTPEEETEEATEPSTEETTEEATEPSIEETTEEETEAPAAGSLFRSGDIRIFIPDPANRKGGINDAVGAQKAAESCAKDMEYDDAFSKLELFRRAATKDGIFYRFRQTSDGKPVYKRYVTVAVGTDSTLKEIVSDAVDLSQGISGSASVSADEVRKKISEYADKNWKGADEDLKVSGVSAENLVIYADGTDARLAYCVYAVNRYAYEVVVDAADGSVLEASRVFHDISVTGTNEDKSKQFPISYDEEGGTDLYVLKDEDRNIEILDLDGNNSFEEGALEAAKPVTSEDTTFGNDDEDEETYSRAIELMTGAVEIADFYSTSFGQGTPFGKLKIYFHDGFDAGKKMLSGRGTADRSKPVNQSLCFGQICCGSAVNGNLKGLLAHEYAHAVHAEYDAAGGGNKETAAIREGLADVFAMFFLKSWDLDLSAVGGTHRNAENPGKYNYPDTVTKSNGSGEDDAHAYAAAISHAAFLMNQSGAFEGNALAGLWYKTMLCLPADCSYGQLRLCMEKTALGEGCTQSQIRAIADAFSKVGIE